jgi:hypothetical protein
MTFEEREQLLSKDALSIKDLERLLGLTYQSSAKLIRQIKFKFDRLKIEGHIHTEDYFEYFNITDKQRYVKPIN